MNLGHETLSRTRLTLDSGCVQFECNDRLPDPFDLRHDGNCTCSPSLRDCTVRASFPLFSHQQISASWSMHLPWKEIAPQTTASVEAGTKNPAFTCHTPTESRSTSICTNPCRQVQVQRTSLSSIKVRIIIYVFSLPKTFPVQYLWNCGQVLVCLPKHIRVARSQLPQLVNTSSGAYFEFTKLVSLKQCKGVVSLRVLQQSAVHH